MAYTCKYFAIEELVCSQWFDYAKKKNAVNSLWKAFDENLLKALDGLRERFGPLIVNNWKAGGSRNNSGLRIYNTTVGAVCSQHKFGRAIDFISNKVSPKEIYNDLVQSGGLKPNFKQNNPSSAWAKIERLEYYPGITWTHIDTMPGNSDGSIKVFSA